MSFAFEPLKGVLDQSPGLRVKGGKTFEAFSGGRYDDVRGTDRVTVYAKASLLNLFAKLSTVKEPVHNRKPWFAFVTQLLEISTRPCIRTASSSAIRR